MNIDGLMGKIAFYTGTDRPLLIVGHTEEEMVIMMNKLGGLEFARITNVSIALPSEADEAKAAFAALGVGRSAEETRELAALPERGASLTFDDPLG